MAINRTWQFNFDEASNRSQSKKENKKRKSNGRLKVNTVGAPQEDQKKKFQERKNMIPKTKKLMWLLCKEEHRLVSMQEV